MLNEKKAKLLKDEFEKELKDYPLLDRVITVRNKIVFDDPDNWFILITAHSFSFKEISIILKVVDNHKMTMVLITANERITAYIHEP